MCFQVIGQEVTDEKSEAFDKDSCSQYAYVENLYFKYKYKEASECSHDLLDYAHANYDSDSMNHVHGLIGRIELYLSNFEEADSFYTLVIDNEPTDSLYIIYSLYHLEMEIGNENMESADSLINILGKIINEESPTNVRVHYHGLRVLFHMAKDDRLAALEENLAIKAFIKPEDNPTFALSVNHNIANNYRDLYDYNSAFELLQENLEIGKRDSNLLIISYAYLTLYDVFEGKRDALSLRKYSKENLDYMKSTGVETFKSTAYAMLAKSFIMENELDSVENYLRKGIAAGEEANDVIGQGENYEEYTHLKLLQGDTLAALEMAEKALGLLGNPTEKLNEYLSGIYSYQKKYKKAYEVLESNRKINETSKEIEYLSLALSRLIENEFEDKKRSLEAKNKQIIAAQQFQYLSIIASLIFLAGSFIIYLLYRNNLRLKEKNIKIAKQNENLKQFAYICSHDLKEPLRTASSFHDLLKRKLKQDASLEDCEPYFEYIKSSHSRLYALVDSLKTFMSIDQGSGETYKSEFDIEELFEQTKSNLQSFINEHNAIVEFFNNTGLSSIKSNKALLTTLLQNLIQNGIKHNDSDNPHVKVYYDIHKKKAQLTISDNGKGIPDEYKKYVFEPFKTLESRSQTNSTGLGLAITKKIIEKIEGSISFDSIEGKGTDFYVKL